MAIVIKSLTKNIIILNVIVVLAFVVISCEDADDGGVNIPLDSSYTLAGTSWKLATIVDVVNNVSREPDYGERGYRSEVYTLAFINDSIITAKNEINAINGQYSADYNTNTLFWSEVITTEICCDKGDGGLYAYVLTGRNASRRFKQYSRELHMFFNDSKEYLKFKKIERVHDEY
jgi:hypothetical protein